MELDIKEMEESMSPETIAGKFCADCKTTKTPLWRSGPTGPKSLCNACGIRHRKRRAAADGNAKSTASSSSSTSTETSTGVVGLKKEEEGDRVKKEAEKMTSKSKKRGAKVKNGIKYEKLSVEWRQRLMTFGEGGAVLFQKQRSQLKKKKQRIDGEKRWGEVEEAAVLLMSLSYGSVFA